MSNKIDLFIGRFPTITAIIYTKGIVHLVVRIRSRFIYRNFAVVANILVPIIGEKNRFRLGTHNTQFMLCVAM